MPRETVQGRWMTYQFLKIAEDLKSELIRKRKLPPLMKNQVRKKNSFFHHNFRMVRYRT